MMAIVMNILATTMDK